MAKVSRARSAKVPSSRTGTPRESGKSPSKGMDRINGRLFHVLYSPGKKLFQIVVRLSDAPGSYRSVLDVLSPRVNLIGTSTYTLSDGTAIFSGFSEALSKKDSASSLRELILSSKAAIEAEVLEGKEGLLFDSFHTGLEAAGAGQMVFRRKGEAHMMDDIVKMLGSGGETLLFEEGFALGQESTKGMIDFVGIKMVNDHWEYFGNYFSARGWGVVEMERGSGRQFTTFRVSDCFECSGGVSFRKGCNFYRGYLAGVCATVTERSLKCTEVKCRLKGADLCEFQVNFA